MERMCAAISDSMFVAVDMFNTYMYTEYLVLTCELIMSSGKGRGV